MTTDKKPENVKIPLVLFIDLYMYFRLPTEGRKPELENRIRNQLNDRYEKWYNHTIFSAYRTATSEEERKKFLTEYLERIDIPDDIRQLLRQDQEE